MALKYQRLLQKVNEWLLAIKDLLYISGIKSLYKVREFYTSFHFRTWKVLAPAIAVESSNKVNDLQSQTEEITISRSLLLNCPLFVFGTLGETEHCSKCKLLHSNGSALALRREYKATPCWGKNLLRKKCFLPLNESKTTRIITRFGTDFLVSRDEEEEERQKNKLRKKLPDFYSALFRLPRVIS